MAAVFNVQGPCAVKIAGSVLGHTPNDQLISWTVEHGSVRLTSSRGGTAPLDAVYTGSIATLDLVLEEWDSAVWKSLMQPPGSSTYGKVGVPGTKWLGNKTFVTLLQPVDRLGVDATPTALKPAVTFPISFNDGPNAGRVFDMGNEATKIGFSITAIANSLDVLFSIAES